MQGLDNKYSRRQVVQAAVATGLSSGFLGLAGAAESGLTCDQVTCRRIPSTGELVPAIGVGTNRFGRPGLETIKHVLTTMYEAGGRVIDTAAMYEGSEKVIGQALTDLGLQDEMFVATKFNAAGARFDGTMTAAGAGELTAEESFERSLEWLQTDTVDLLFAHFVSSVEPLMPQLESLKEQGRARHTGITTVQRAQHPRIMEYMRRYSIDFVQVDYSLENRGAASDVLPLAEELGVAIMVAVPFGGRRSSLFSSVGDRPLPEWAAEFGATTWAQFFLKYVVSHPAVTCVIPGTTDVEHMTDNQMAGQGALPDEDMRHRMEAFWDSISED